VESLVTIAALLAITFVSIQMGLFFNWVLLSLMLKAMNRVRPVAENSPSNHR
jgi:hypothetical protein